MKLNNEEELFDLILELYDKSNEYSILFSYVICNKLTTESIPRFPNIFDFNDINSHIWKNICQRLEQDISHQNHILRYLKEKFKGNVLTKNVVNITASSIIHHYYKVEKIVEEDDNRDFYTKDEPNSWIKFDFKETLKTYNDSEVSDDDNITESDRYENCDLLNDPQKTPTFEVSHSTPARFVCLRIEYYCFSHYLQKV